MMDKLNRKNYCIFSANYYPYLGGVETFTRNLAAALVEAGNSVAVVTNNTKQCPQHEITPEGIEIFRLPCLPLMNGRMPFPKKNKTYSRMMGEIYSREWDGVLVNTRFYFHSLEGLKTARKAEVKPIVCEHGSAYLSLNNVVLDQFIRAWEHLITARVKQYHPAFCAVSKKSAEWLNTFGIACRGVLSNSIDAATFRESASVRDFRYELGISGDDFIMCFIGRYVPEKGIVKLLDAMKQLDDVPIKLLMAGAGPLKGDIDACGLSSVYDLGRLQPPDVAALMCQSDLMCLPTRSEGFCTSLLEAAACSLPSLITPVGGTDELIPSDEYGNLLPQDCTAVDVANAAKRLYESPEVLRRQGENANRLVSIEYSWKNTASKYVELNSRIQDE
ncbi:MAG: glycosyltransferase family 1 protein [Coriobacteriaceae bacterium]|nr:MAG: glycosyltransferase family 1 protein [Coriobacteriaceae bacterium]